MTDTLSPRLFITGGGHGLGRALARRANASGYRVWVTDISPTRANDTIAGLERPGEACARGLDVRDAAAVALALDAMCDAWGGCDVLVNNAGVAGAGPFEWLEEADWDHVMDVNFRGVRNGCRAFLKHARRQGHGHIVNVASMAGLLNPPGMASYNVSKAAVIALSETLAVELAPMNVTVSCLCPSFFRSGLGESLRSPDAGMAATLDRLLTDSEGIDAHTVADEILRAIETRAFLVLPHPRARAAFAMKQQDLAAWMTSQRPLAERMITHAQRQPPE